MKPRFEDVRATCPECGAVATFEYKSSANEFGTGNQQRPHRVGGELYTRATYKLMRCAACGRGGLAELHHNGGEYFKATLGVYPQTLDSCRSPMDVPPGVSAEFAKQNAAHLLARGGQVRRCSGLY